MMMLNKSQGFTLVELVMIIVLVGIISVYALPRIGDMDAYNLTHAQGELMEAIRFAQETSMIRIDTGYQIVTSNAGYLVQEYDYGTDSLSNMTNPMTGTAPFVDTNWDGVTASNLTLSFDARGYPCAQAAPCDTHMTAVQNITLTADGETRTVFIEPLTGFVHD